jgi:hydrogenase nickel incorporation protein HypA/HybF
MHELGIVIEMFDLLEEIKKEQGLKKISTVTVEVGELSGVMCDYLKECWNVARLGGTFENTQLDVEFHPAFARCDCGEEFEMMKNSRICPKCHKSNYSVISGREFEIKQIEAI